MEREEEEDWRGRMKGQGGGMGNGDGLIRNNEVASTVGRHEGSGHVLTV